MRTRILLLTCVVALGVLICLPGSASAAPIGELGTGDPGGQNGQNFTLTSGMGFYWTAPSSITFDKFVTYVTGGSEIFSDLHDGYNNYATIDYGNFHSTGWTGTKINATTSQASSTT